MPDIKGKIFLLQAPKEDTLVIVYVRLIENSKIDLPSVKIAESIYNSNLQILFRKGLSFLVNIDHISLNKRYEISVLVDVDEDGKTGKGDYINKQSYPVLTMGCSDYVEIEVSLI